MRRRMEAKRAYRLHVHQVSSTPSDTPSHEAARDTARAAPLDLAIEMKTRRCPASRAQARPRPAPCFPEHRPKGSSTLAGPIRLAPAVVLLVALAGCGGGGTPSGSAPAPTQVGTPSAPPPTAVGGDSATAPAPSGTTSNPPADASGGIVLEGAPPAPVSTSSLPATPAPPPPPPSAAPGSNSPQRIGAWSAQADWPLIAIHGALLPDGRVMSYGSDRGGSATGKFHYDVWDPSAGLAAASHLTLPNTTGTDTFCSAQVLLSDGTLLIAGGDVYIDGRTINNGNPDTMLFDPVQNRVTAGARMARPRWYATTTKTADDRIYVQGGRDGEDIVEVREPDGSFHTLTAIDSRPQYWYYPRNYSAPDGRIFGYGTNGGAYSVSTVLNGALLEHGYLPIPIPSNSSSSTLFAPGRVLQCGSADNCSIIDFNGPFPVTAPTAKLSGTREWQTGTLLPDGRVLITGGTRVWSDSELIGPNTSAEIWDPRTGTFTVGAAAVQPRIYHSIALLLPDATVLVAGGGAPGPLAQLNAELYRPPYLFSDTAPARRPVLTEAPTLMTPGAPLTLGVDDGSRIARLTLVKTGSVTHSFNQDQAFVELPFSRTGNTLTATVPDSGGDLTPGFYMIFVLDAAGVPSVAKIARMSVAPTLPPRTPWTPIAGATVGDRFTLACATGEVLAGVRGTTTGSGLGRLVPSCVRAGVDGSWRGSPADARDGAGSEGGTFFSLACPANQAVSGLQTRGDGAVSALQLQCRPLGTGGLTVQAGFGAPTTPAGPGSGALQPMRECAGGFAARGLYGHAGSSVAGVGLLCRRPVDAIQVSAAATR
jgi:hypothetical protein